VKHLCWSNIFIDKLVTNWPAAVVVRAVGCRVECRQQRHVVTDDDVAPAVVIPAAESEHGWSLTTAASDDCDEDEAASSEYKAQQERLTTLSADWTPHSADTINTHPHNSPVFYHRSWIRRKNSRASSCRPPTVPYIFTGPLKISVQFCFLFVFKVLLKQNCFYRPVIFI